MKLRYSRRRRTTLRKGITLSIVLVVFLTLLALLVGVYHHHKQGGDWSISLVQSVHSVAISTYLLFLTKAGECRRYFAPFASSTSIQMSESAERLAWFLEEDASTLRTVIYLAKTAELAKTPPTCKLHSVAVSICFTYENCFFRLAFDMIVCCLQLAFDSSTKEALLETAVLTSLG